LRVLFDTVDRNADGRLSRAEMDAFLAMQQTFTRLPLNLVYGADTPGLFQLLDANSDGRLSIREIRNSFDRLIAYEPASKTHFSANALQPQGTIRFGTQRDAQLFAPAGGGSPNYFNPTIRPTTTGPIWFQKFDRNADGELSRAEYLGTDADFKTIDTDNDGFITLAEATKHDAKLRKRDR
jgi:EF hand